MNSVGKHLISSMLFRESGDIYQLTKQRLLANAFTDSQFNYVPLIWKTFILKAHN